MATPRWKIVIWDFNVGTFGDGEWKFKLIPVTIVQFLLKIKLMIYKRVKINKYNVLKMFFWITRPHLGWEWWDICLSLSWCYYNNQLKFYQRAFMWLCFIMNFTHNNHQELSINVVHYIFNKLYHIPRIFWS